VRDLNRLELLAETLRAALNAIAVAAPDWVHALAPLEWHEGVVNLTNLRTISANFRGSNTTSSA
jgi:hypothetical protein